MDPEATLLLAATLLRDGDNRGALEALKNYDNWRRRGGFAPPNGDKRARDMLKQVMRRGPFKRKKNPVRSRRAASGVRGGRAHRVVIKGGKFAVARVMADAGIPFLFVRESGANTVGDVPNQHIRKLTALLNKHPKFEGRFAQSADLHAARISAGKRRNPVRITSPRAGTRRQFRVYTRKHGSPWAITVKTNSVKHALDSAGKLEKRGYRVRVTQVR